MDGAAPGPIFVQILPMSPPPWLALVTCLLLSLGSALAAPLRVVTFNIETNRDGSGNLRRERPGGGSGR